MNRLTRNPLLFGTTVLLLSTAALYGCSDFLDNAAAPEGTLNEATLSNATGVEGSLIATYRAVEWNEGVGGAWGNAASNWVWGSVASDDAYKGSEKDDQPPINDIEAYFWGTADAEGYLNDKWRGMYEGVVRANATLRLLKEVVAKLPNEISAARQASIEGEAKFLRAHFHFEAYRMWGSIPYYKEDDTDFRKANEDTTAVLTDILADLDAAIAKLPTTQGEKARATKWTAEAYKARVMTYKASVTHAAADWAAALTQLRKFAPGAGHPYGLETSFDKVWTGFQTAENGPETILVYQSSVDTDPNGNNSNWGERLNFPHSGSPFGCCGFHQPSQNLVNFYKVDGAGLPLAFSQGTGGATPSAVSLNEATAGWNSTSTTFVGGPTNTTPVDPRLDWTVGRDDVPYKDWGLHAIGWIRAPSYGGRYSPKKNAHEHTSGSEASKGWVPTQLNGVNIHIFRYADLLLMLAEAEVEAGSLANATTYVNLVRTRAGQRVQGCGTPTDAALAGARTAEIAKYPQCATDSRIAVPMGDPSVTWAVYNVQPYPATFASQAQGRLAVQIERRLELAMEGQRFFDLRRWNTFAKELNDYVTIEKTRQQYLTAAGITVDPVKHRFYPIPPVQIELSKVGGTPMLKQWSSW